MRNICILLLLIPVLASSQKIVYDKKDPFTGNVSKSTESLPLYGQSRQSIIDAGGILSISKSGVRDYQIVFGSPKLGLEVSSIDTPQRQCKILLANGSTLIGKWDKTYEVEVYPGSTRMVSSFFFSKSDFVLISENDATDIMFTGDRLHQMQFEVTKKNRSNLSKIAAKLLNVE